MLDIRSKAVLKYLVKETTEGSYKILEAQEIMDSIPKKFKPDREIVFQIMNYLEVGNYVSIKYSDENQFCVAPLPFGRQYIENDDLQAKNTKIFMNLVYKNNIITFIFAFLGSFLAILLYHLIL